MTLSMPKESIVFLGGVLLSCALVPLALPVLRRLGVVDLPNARSTHTTAIPRGAGLVVVLTFLMVLAAYAVMASGAPLAEAGRLEALAAAVLLLVCVGFWDDMRGVPAAVRLLVQAGSAVILIAAGFVMPLPSIFGAWQGTAEWVFTLVWIVGVINAINFIDGSDGLATTLSTLCMLIFVGISRIAPRELAEGSADVTKMINLLGLAGAGSALPFLLYNVSPARCFLGDAGSTFFGLLLAVLGILSAQYHLAVDPEKLDALVGFKWSFLLVPWMVLLVPIADGIRVTGGRVLQGKSPLRPDNQHLHHLLTRAGLSPNQVLFLVSLAVMTTGMGAAILVRSNRGPFLLIGVGIILVYGLLWFFKSSYRARRFVALAVNRRLLPFVEAAEGYENPVSFKERFEQELARAKRHNGSLSVLVVNSTNGKHGGSEASPLENPAFLANLLKKLRREDIKCRFSGDRLAFLLVETDRELASHVSERIRELFLGIAQGESAGLRVGIGLAAYPEEGESAPALLQFAEAAALADKTAAPVEALGAEPVPSVTAPIEVAALVTVTNRRHAGNGDAVILGGREAPEAAGARPGVEAVPSQDIDRRERTWSDVVRTEVALVPPSAGGNGNGNGWKAE
jgi:UDP-GlcNAc:undecaprenyl-phosphate GlcNAc-1-phosphate transferase